MVGGCITFGSEEKRVESPITLIFSCLSRDLRRRIGKNEGKIFFFLRFFMYLFCFGIKCFFFQVNGKGQAASDDWKMDGWGFTGYSIG